VKPLVARPLVEQMSLVAPTKAMVVESSISASSLNIRHILVDIEQVQGGSSKTEADAKKAGPETVEEVEMEVKVAHLEAAKMVVKEVEAQQGETKQAKATVKEERLDPEGKSV
jgi:hypothetical protein